MILVILFQNMRRNDILKVFYSYLLYYKNLNEFLKNYIYIYIYIYIFIRESLRSKDFFLENSVFFHLTFSININFTLLRSGSKLEKRSVIESLMVEKYKQCNFYRRICDVYEEKCVGPKMFTIELDKVLLLRG